MIQATSKFAQVLGNTVNGTTYAGIRARTTGAPQNHWFGPAGDPRQAFHKAGLLLYGAWPYLDLHFLRATACMAQMRWHWHARGYSAGLVVPPRGCDGLWSSSHRLERTQGFIEPIVCA